MQPGLGRVCIQTVNSRLALVLWAQGLARGSSATSTLALCAHLLRRRLWAVCIGEAPAPDLIEVAYMRYPPRFKAAVRQLLRIRQGAAGAVVGTGGRAVRTACISDVPQPLFNRILHLVAIQPIDAWC